MKGAINWLFGDDLGESVLNAYNWLLETPPDRSATKGKTNDEIEIEHMTQLLESMRAKVAELKINVDRTRRNATEIKSQYNSKIQYRAEVLKLTRQYKLENNMVEARLAMATAIRLERMIPEFKARLDSSEEMLMEVSEIYAQQELELSLLEIDLENMKTYMAIDYQTNSDRDRELAILKEKIRASSIEAEDRCRAIQIASQISRSPNCDLPETLTLDDIEERIRDLEDL